MLRIDPHGYPLLVSLIYSFSLYFVYFYSDLCDFFSVSSLPQFGGLFFLFLTNISLTLNFVGFLCLFIFGENTLNFLSQQISSILQLKFVPLLVQCWYFVECPSYEFVWWFFHYSTAVKSFLKEDHRGKVWFSSSQGYILSTWYHCWFWPSSSSWGRTL